MDTLLLDPNTWDLVLDNAGNIALASALYPAAPATGLAYAQAQDAASAIRLFQGELYYDNAQGVPYWQEILGHLPSLALMKAKFTEAALTVPGVVSAKCFIATLSSREVTGQVQITNSAGQTAAAGF